MVAVAAAVPGATVAANSPPPLAATFGTAQDVATFAGSPSHLLNESATLRNRLGNVGAIETVSLAIPGSTGSYLLQAQDPHGRFTSQLLQLDTGRYPSGTGEVAMTQSVAFLVELASHPLRQPGELIRCSPAGQTAW